MSQQENRPETLISVPSDLEAAMIVSALAAQDVDATTTGSFTAGFRAEAPGEVQVLVRKQDLARAQSLLADIRVNQAANKVANQSVALVTEHSPSKYLAFGFLILLTFLALISWL